MPDKSPSAKKSEYVVASELLYHLLLRKNRLLRNYDAPMLYSPVDLCEIRQCPEEEALHMLKNMTPSELWKDDNILFKGTFCPWCVRNTDKVETRCGACTWSKRNGFCDDLGSQYEISRDALLDHENREQIEADSLKIQNWFLKQRILYLDSVGK